MNFDLITAANLTVVLSAVVKMAPMIGFMLVPLIVGGVYEHFGAQN